MGAARRLCVKAVALAGLISAILSLALPGCQFPEYGSASARAGSGSTDGGTFSSAGEGPNDGGEGGGEAGGQGGESGEGPAPAPPCALQACVPGAPTGWVGPIAFWEGKAGAASALPNCPRGYADPTDLHRELVAPASACTCTCAAQDQVCETTLRIYDDMTCVTNCATVSVLSCNGVSGCNGSQGSLRNDPPTVSGGSCQATVSEPVAASWQYNARLCQPSSVCEDPAEVCAPTPAPPYVTLHCVMRVIPEGEEPPACPAEYPNGGKTFYDAFTDDRGCSNCSCGGVTGGSCSGKIVMSADGDCSDGFDYQLGTGCKAFNLGMGEVHPSRVGGEYSVVPGTCSVVSPAHATGSAAASGAVTKVCCQQ